jgi:hypothetical protein
MAALTHPYLPVYNKLSCTNNETPGEYLLALVCYNGSVVWDQLKVGSIQSLVSLRRPEDKINTA